MAFELMLKYLDPGEERDNPAEDGDHQDRLPYRCFPFGLFPLIL